MKVGTTTKQSAEVRRWAIDYSEALDDGDVIASVSTVASPAGLTVEAYVAGTNKIRLVCSGGSSGVNYVVTTTTVTNYETFEDELVVRVKDIL